MVKVNLGLQFVAAGELTTANVDALGELVRAQLAQVAQVQVSVEVHDYVRSNYNVHTHLRVHVECDRFSAHLIAPLCELLSMGSAMFVQLQNATEDHVYSFCTACSAHSVDVDMHHDGDAQGIAYPYTALQLQTIMGALR